MTPERDVVQVNVDPRLIDAVVDFTGEVADVASSLANTGACADEAERLTAALDRLDAAGED